MRRYWVLFVAAIGLSTLAARNDPSGDIQPSGGAGGNASITSPLDLGANGMISFGPDATGAQDSNQRICVGPVNPTSNSGAGGFNSIAIGSGAEINIGSDASGDRNICIGAACSVTVGSGGTNFRNTAIGATAATKGYRNVALGTGAACYGTLGTAVGNFATVGAPLSEVTQSIAIGHQAANGNNYSTAIGAGATTKADHQIMLGTAAESVVVPGQSLSVGPGSAVVWDGNRTVWSSIGPYASCGTGCSRDSGNPNQSIYIGAPDPNALLSGAYSVHIGTGSGYYGGTAPQLASADMIAIGEYPTVRGFRGTAIGAYTVAAGQRSIAIGGTGTAAGAYSIAIGPAANANTPAYGCTNCGSLALGHNASTGLYTNSAALGPGAAANANNQIMLGTDAETVVHPGPTTLTGAVTAASTIAASGAVSGASFGVPAKSVLQSSADGYFSMYNNAGSGFTGLRFGGLTASFPMLKRSTTGLQCRLADDTADAPFSASTGTFSGALTGNSISSTGGVTAGGAFMINSKSKIMSSADGYFSLYNAAGTGFTGLRFGGLTSSFPMLKVNGTGLSLRLADDTADSSFTASVIGASTALRSAAGGVSAPSISFTSDTTTGLFNVAASHKMGVAINGNQFIGMIPVVGAYGAMGMNVDPITNTTLYMRSTTADSTSYAWYADTPGGATLGGLRGNGQFLAQGPFVTASRGTANNTMYQVVETGNGMYSPGTNQLAFATNSTLALAIDASQNANVLGNLIVTGQAVLGSFTFVNSGNANAYGLAIGTDTQQTRIVRLGPKLAGVVDNATSGSAFVIQGQYTIPSTAAANTLGSTNSGTCWTNTGVASSTSQVFTLPTAPTVGHVECFEMTDAPSGTTLAVAAGGSDTIRIPGITGTLFTTLTTSTQYSVVRLKYSKTNVWMAQSVIGTWTEN